MRLLFLRSLVRRIAVVTLLLASLAAAKTLYSLPDDQGACCIDSECHDTSALLCPNKDSFVVGGSCSDAQVCGSCCDVSTNNFACGSIFNDSLWCPAGEFRTNFYCPVYYADATVDVTGIANVNGSFWYFDATYKLAGFSLAFIGDVNGDGNGDVVVSGIGTSNEYEGAISVAFMSKDGDLVRTNVQTPDQIFGDLVGGGSAFGMGLIGVGDVNEDGIPDIAAGGIYVETEDSVNGFLSILFLDENGTAFGGRVFFPEDSELPASFAEIPGSLGNNMCYLGDWARTGYKFLALGNPYAGNGSLYLMRIGENAGLTLEVEFSRNDFPFPDNLADTYANPMFGWSCASPGDLDGNGVADLVVGAELDTDATDPTGQRGVVWVLLMETPFTVKSAVPIGHRWIKDLDPYALFGSSVTAAGDLDQNGVPDIWVGAAFWSPNDTDTEYLGALYAVFLRENGYPVGYETFSNKTIEGFPILRNTFLGSNIAATGDWYNTGSSALLVGTGGGGEAYGEAGVFFLEISRVSTLCTKPLPPDHIVNPGVVAVIAVAGGMLIVTIVAGIVALVAG